MSPTEVSTANARNAAAASSRETASRRGRTTPETGGAGNRKGRRSAVRRLGVGSAAPFEGGTGARSVVIGSQLH